MLVSSSRSFTHSTSFLSASQRQNGQLYIEVSRFDGLPISLEGSTLNLNESPDLQPKEHKQRIYTKLSKVPQSGHFLAERPTVRRH